MHPQQLPADDLQGSSIRSAARQRDFKTNPAPSFLFMTLVPSPEPPVPLPIGEYAALIGWDWADQEHVLSMLPRGALRREELTLPQEPCALHAWIEALGRRFHHQPVAVAVEASRGPIVAALLEYSWIQIYPIHPATSRRFSEAFAPSGAKDDLPDARVLLDLLIHHRDRLRAFLPFEDSTRRLALLAETRRKLVDQRTALTNQLTSLLKQYFPQALDWVGATLYAPLALNFLTRWPTLEALQKARRQTLRDFYYAGQVRRPEVVEARLAAIRQARPLMTDGVLYEVSQLYLPCLLAQIRSLNTHLEKLDQALAQAFLAHPDAALFSSFPGAGKVMAPRLCVLFGEDRRRWPSAAELQQQYGIAPVIKKSGKKSVTHWRWNAPIFARQTLVEWSGISIKACDWAKAYYLLQRQRGKSHSAILRALAFKWLRILWRCWQDRRPYDDARYTQSLVAKNVPFLSLLPTK